jgi:uncharacterized protein YndB with AHSA1/START domain
VRLITITMATVIDSTTQRVWRALTDPDELVSWDDRMLAPAEDLDRYPFCGQHARWRYRLGSVPLVMHDRPLEVDAPHRLRGKLNIGSLGYERTFNLQAENSNRTRLSMRLIAPNSIPLVGETVDRFDVRAMATAQVDITLRSVQKWCEENP